MFSIRIRLFRSMKSDAGIACGKRGGRRQEIFREYNQTEFERVFTKHFRIEESAKLPESERTVYLMSRR